MRSAMRWSRLVAALALAVGSVPVVAVPAYAVVPCSGQQAPPLGTTMRDVPYPLLRYAPDRLTPLSTGKGVTVAVIDSGVDDRHPQLRGRVLPGRDLLANNPDAQQDCAGHGTGVASIIAAQPAEGTGFRGLAPSATVLPVRVTERKEIEEENPGRYVGSDGFAEAIRWAVRNGARGGVINLSVSLNRDVPAVRSAVDFALANDVVVVAAAGNASEADAAKEPYPARYDGVLAVGAVDENGLWADFSLTGDYVDVAAPGSRVTMAAVGSGHLQDSGTSFAAPYVAATAALIRARYPDLPAEDVVRLILATADPAPGGNRSDKYGIGIVNPYRALTERLADQPPRAPAPVTAERVDPAAQALAERRDASRDRALLVGIVGLGAAVLAVGLGLILPRGLRRRWRPAA